MVLVLTTADFKLIQNALLSHFVSYWSECFYVKFKQLMKTVLLTESCRVVSARGDVSYFGIFWYIFVATIAQCRLHYAVFRWLRNLVK